MALTSPLEQTLPILIARAEKYFSEFRSGGVQIQQRPLVDRSTYPIHLLELGQGALRRQIVVKFAPVFPENNEGKTEFDNMTRLWNEARRTDAGLGFVRALDFIEETNALVTEFIDARRLSPLVVRSARYRAPEATVDTVVEAVCLAGRWLRAMHSATSYGTPVLRNTRFLVEFERLLDASARLNLLRNWLPRIRLFLESAMPSVGGLEAPMALVHGDFGPQNMALAGSKIYVFDLQRDYAEVIYHDLAYFLVTLRTLNPYPRHLLFSRRKILRLAEPFLRGYFGRDLHTRERVVLEFFYLRNLVQRALKQFLGSDRSRSGSVAVRTAIDIMYPRILRSQMRNLGLLIDSEAKRDEAATWPSPRAM
jgi:hypothetical protein